MLTHAYFTVPWHRHTTLASLQTQSYKINPFAELWRGGGQAAEGRNTGKKKVEEESFGIKLVI